VVLLREGFPVNVLNPLKGVPEVCTIICATANPVEVLVAVTERRRGIISVIDGSPTLGVEPRPTLPSAVACYVTSATSFDPCPARSRGGLPSTRTG
jgi:hypothetical protein